MTGRFAAWRLCGSCRWRFPRTGAVTAKVIAIRDDGTVNCSGNAENNSALLAVEANLSKLPGVSAVHRDQSRGNKAPMQFVFSFKYKQRRWPVKIKNRQEFLVMLTIAAVGLFVGVNFVFTPLQDWWSERQTQIRELRDKVTRRQTADQAARPASAAAGRKCATTRCRPTRRRRSRSF